MNDSSSDDSNGKVERNRRKVLEITGKRNAQPGPVLSGNMRQPRWTLGYTGIGGREYDHLPYSGETINKFHIA